MHLTPGAIVNTRFRLERPLASGAMGAVWVARHLELDLPVALKFIGAAAGASATSRVRFEREARAAAQMRSPYVVQILDYGVDDGTPYLAMELLDGEDLGSRLQREGRLSLRALSAIVTQLAKGLKLAHDAGIVHRDLKPSNVFLARIGDEEIVKILDFGVAKETRPNAAVESTTTGLLLGSPAYMSPEQVRGGTLDARSDLWSLGVLCYLALTGQRPFAGEHVGDVLVKVCSSEAPAATSVAPNLPVEIDAFFDRALCKSPDGRFASARALAEELAAITQRAGDSASWTPAAASVEGGAVTRSQATLSMQAAAVRTGDEPDAMPASSGGAATRTLDLEPTTRSTRTRWTWFVAGGAALAALGVVLSGQLREGGATPKSVEAEPLPSATAAAAAATIVEPLVVPTAAPVPSAPPAQASATTAPSAAPAANGRRPRPATQPSRSTTAPQPTLDPKFGLPVKAP